MRHAIGLTGQYAAVDEYLTGRENMRMFGGALPPVAEVREGAHGRAAGVVRADRRRRPAREDVLRRHAAAARPRVEPGRPAVDPVPRRADHRSRSALAARLWEVIQALVVEGTTVLLTTQYLEEADQLAQDIVVIDHGRVIAHGTADELKDQIGGDRIEVAVTDVVTGRARGGAAATHRRRASRWSRRPASWCRSPVGRRFSSSRAARSTTEGIEVVGHRPAPADARRRVPVADRARGRGGGRTCPKGRGRRRKEKSA